VEKLGDICLQFENSPKQSLLQLAQESGVSADNASMSVKLLFVRFEVFTALTMKNGVFWGVTSQKTPFFKLLLFACVKLLFSPKLNPCVMGKE
jgi:hypothetical protein